LTNFRNAQSVRRRSGAASQVRAAARAAGILAGQLAGCGICTPHMPHQRRHRLCASPLRTLTRDYSRNPVLKLHQDSSGALNTVTGYGADYVEVNLERHAGSIIVMPEVPVVPWPVQAFDALTPELFAMLLPLDPEVVVFGSGERLRFPHPRLTAALAAKRIGVEAMDFKAACRTYNILMAEGRRVAAALLIES
jgi:uncharacterized protein